jgi:hypothetical protein
MAFGLFCITCSLTCSLLRREGRLSDGDQKISLVDMEEWVPIIQIIESTNTFFLRYSFVLCACDLLRREDVWSEVPRSL